MEFFIFQHLHLILFCKTPILIVYRSAICNAGYKVSQSHCIPQAIKTDAPSQVLWDILRSLHKSQGAKGAKEFSPASKILETPITTSIDFSSNPLVETNSIRFKMIRFQMNPAPNWGPKSRPGKEKKDTKPTKQKRKRENTHEVTE